MNHFEELAKAIETSHTVGIERWPKYIDECANNGGKVFVIGNGGSSAIASHFAGDLMKAAWDGTSHKKPLVICLSDNTPIMTATANDTGHDRMFSNQLKYYSASKDDILIAISSSGNSQNIILAVLRALKTKMKVLTMTGFAFNNSVKEMVTGPEDIGTAMEHHLDQIWAASDCYEVVEDIHHMCMHGVIRGYKQLMNGWPA